MAENVFYDQNQTSSESDENEEWYTQIREEEIAEKTEKLTPCDSCVRESPFSESVAVFLCFLCEMYVCVNCLPRHESHKGMKVWRKDSEREKERETLESTKLEEQGSSEMIKNKEKGLGKKTKRMRLEAESEREENRERSESERMEEECEGKIELLLNELMNESETERIEKFDSSHVSVHDRVNVKHELDQRGQCRITGLCGLENGRLVVCDVLNRCIKIFKEGSHVLQRYIRVTVSLPWDVTEIHLKQNSTERNLVSGSSFDISETDRADPDKQCFIAVTLPDECQIMFIDLSKKPAKTQDVISTEGHCRSLQFYDDKIFTLCWTGIGFHCSVSVHSTDGATLNKFDTAISCYVLGPYFAVSSGRVYLTDYRNHKIQCRNVEGQIISQITIKESRPEGISVDLDNNVFVCARDHMKIYKLDADLTRYNSLSDQTAEYIQDPVILCYHKDKLFISHQPTSLHDIVTVVRLL